MQIWGQGRTLLYLEPTVHTRDTIADFYATATPVPGYQLTLLCKDCLQCKARKCRESPSW